MDIFLFVFGYSLAALANLLLIWKIHKTQSIYGLAVDTQIMFALGVVCRCIWTLDTRLIETYAAYAELVVSTLTCIVLCLMCWRYYHTTTMHAMSYLRAYTLAPIALVLAFFFHPSDSWWSVKKKSSLYYKS